MEIAIAIMEEEKELNQPEKVKVVGELRVKKALIDAQAKYLLKLRTTFSENVRENEKNFNQFNEVIGKLNAEELDQYIYNICA